MKRTRQCDSPEYLAWKQMRHRCSRVSHASYRHYGGRGISVCSRWDSSFANFLADMGPRPSPKHSIDRIDNSGNYEPGNCRWATWSVQQSNTRKNRYLSCYGKSMTISGWSRISGIDRAVINFRVRRGWPLKYAIFAPLNSTLVGLIAKYGPRKNASA